MRNTLSKAFFLIFLLSTVFLTGCSDVNTYRNITAEIEKQEQESKEKYAGMKWDEILASKAYELNNKMKAVAPLIILVSEFICFILLGIVKNEKRIRQIAIFVFGIGIPFLSGLIIYGWALIVTIFKS